MSTPMNCVCALCRKPLFEEDAKADHFVYKLGELDYIELAHESCAIIDNGKDARVMSQNPGIKPYWSYGSKEAA